MKRRFTRGVIGGFFAALVFLLALVSSGTEAAPAAQPQNTQSNMPPPLRSTTRLVKVSVVVQDKHGNPIVDLRKDDFVVLDNKKPQDVRIFSMETNRSPLHAQAPLPLDTYSSLSPGKGDTPANVTVILLDGLNTAFPDQAYARQHVIKFLEQIQPHDRIALYTLGSELQILHDFTSDATSLLAALERYKGDLPRLLDAPDAQNAKNNNGGPASSGYDDTAINTSNMLSAFLNSSARQDEIAFRSQNRISQTLSALMQIAYHVSSLQGRKNLIWVSGSFPVIPGYMMSGINAPDENMLFAKDLEAAERELNNVTPVVYPVDARGLMDMSMGYSNYVAMNNIAHWTGGRAFYNTNDIKGAIRTAIEDSRVTYELAYYPESGNWDGKFHTIKVKVNRQGARVRARAGYVARQELKADPSQRNTILSQAATSLVQANRLDVTVHINRASTDETGARTLAAAITMNPHQLNLKQQAGLYAGVVELVFLQLNNQNRIIDTIESPYQLTLQPTTYERPPEQGFTLLKELPILPGAVDLRVVLRDPSTAMDGAVAVPLAKYFPERKAPR